MLPGRITCPNSHAESPRPLHAKTLYLIITAAIALVVALGAALPGLRVSSAGNTEMRTGFERARLSEHVTVRLSGPRNINAGLSLRDGRELLSSYEGPAKLQRALAQNEAQPRSLASADFDEDGVPDLVSGYSNEGRGIVTIHRGNVDSIYPNAPEAQERKAKGNFTNAPFLSPALAIEVATAPDFVGAGDFDADGHWDIVLASRGGNTLYFLPGDGKGNFAMARAVSLPGGVTAFTTGEINRRDGLTDIVLGVDGKDGAQVQVFEGPDGALRSTPEVFNLPTPATSLALGQLDDHYASDLAIAAGSELHVVYGRDRKLSLDAREQASVAVAKRESRKFVSPIRSLALGDFTGTGSTDVALLTADGAISVLDGAVTRDRRDNKIRTGLKNWHTTALAGTYVGACELTRALVSNSTKDDLLVRDADNRQFRLLSSNVAGNLKGNDDQRTVTTLNADHAPAAVLPMRLDADALTDLVVLRDGTTSPVVLGTANSQVGQSPGQTLAFDSFSNPAPINMPSSSASPPKPASLYPSTINVTGLTGTISKVRVRLHGVSMGSFAQDIDLLLVGPSGQKVLLMSDVNTFCVISNQTFTFDDDATSELEGYNCTTGTYKPKDNAPADTFAAPAPAGPYQTALSAFNGTNPNGTWSLYMVDDVGVFGSSQSIAGGWTLFLGPDEPSTFVVTNTNTSGAGSLSQAILDSNDHLGVDNIIFNIPGQGPFTINAPPPTIIDPVTIDATTQPGFAGKPIIEVRPGFVFIEAGRTLIRGFVLNQTTDPNILIRKNGSNIIEGNYLGTDLSGMAAGGPQGGNGVEIDTANNLIGGTSAAARNVIGNKTHGVMFSTVTADEASNNLVQGNYIGINAAGAAIIPMTHAGITARSLPGSPNNTVGGTTAGARNVIAAGSLASGVDLVYSVTQGWLVQGNFIGTDATGTKVPTSPSFPGGNNDGVTLSGGTLNNLIGGTTPAARNIISANTFNGVNYINNETRNNLVQGNFIGTDLTGTKALANQVGIRTIFDASGNTIGGATAATRNILSGNTIAGIQFGEPTKGGALNNVVQGNFIGTDVTGEVGVPNGRTPFFDDAGIIIPANSRGDRIIENRIAYNKGAGIRITNVSGGDIDSIEIEIADNLIYGNLGLGIDLGPRGITPNDPLDADDGPNHLQNFPELTSVAPTALPEMVTEGEKAVNDGAVAPLGSAAFIVNGTLRSTPSTSFTVHWYFSTDSQCVSNQASSRPLAAGRIPNLTTDSNGNAPFSFPFDFPAGINQGIINCTATDPNGNTSEFSACLSVPAGPPVQVTIRTNPAGRSFTVDGTTYSTTQDVSWTAASSHTIGTTSPQSNGTGTQYVWSSWSDGGGISHTIAPGSNTTYTANFTTQHFLTMNAGSGGTVSPASGFFNSGQSVTITATANSLFTFSGWTGSGSGSFTGSANPATVSMNGPVTEAATFNATPQWQAVALTEQQINQIKAWTVGGRTYVYVKPQFPDAGYRVVNWGQVGRSGSDFTVDASVEKFTGASIQAVVTTAQIYDLGPLADGIYNFNFKTSGTLVKTLQFTVNSAIPLPNPIDAAREFVKQQYRDFLNREADQAGEDFWTDNITKCSDPARRPAGQTEAQCTLRQRETTSGAFFLSPEFQYTGYYVLRMYQGALGRQPKLSEFIPDAQFVGAGILVNSQLSAAKINQNKADFAAQFVNCTDATKYRCSEFKAIYDGLNNQQYVDKLFQTTGVNASAADRAALVNGLNAIPATETRASILQKVVDGIVVIAEGSQTFTTSYGQAFYNSEFNRAFVQLEYFGYMKRDPDDAGYAFWLGKLNQFGGNFVNAEMVLAFISSPEYRARFGQP